MNHYLLKKFAENFQIKLNYFKLHLIQHCTWNYVFQFTAQTSQSRTAESFSETKTFFSPCSHVLRSGDPDQLEMLFWINRLNCRWMVIDDSLLDEIRWSVRTFSWAGHNKAHFLVEDSLWVEALCVWERKIIVSLWKILEMWCQWEVQIPVVYSMHTRYSLVLFQTFLIERQEKNIYAQSLSSPTCSTCNTVSRRTASTFVPISIICKNQKGNELFMIHCRHWWIMRQWDRGHKHVKCFLSNVSASHCLISLSCFLKDNHWSKVNKVDPRALRQTCNIL